MSISLISFLFFLENFNLWHMLLIITLYHQSKTPMSFYYKRRLNLRSLIQLSETLSVELTGTYQNQLISWLNGKEQAYIRSKNHRFQVYHYLKKKKKRVIFEIMSFKIFITKYFNMYWGEEKKKHLQISIKKKWYNFSPN